MAASTIPTVELLAALGRALTYPAAGYETLLDGLVCTLAGVPAAATAVERFQEETGEWPLRRLQETYTRTFDLAPMCIPYASVHLFGEESFKRAEVMTALQAAYTRVGFDRGGELPDHIALMLRAAPRFGEAEWSEVRDMLVRGPLHKMHEAISQSETNPYRHLLAAVQALVGAATAEDLERLQGGNRPSPLAGKKGAGSPGPRTFARVGGCGGGPLRGLQAGHAPEKNSGGDNA